MIQRREKVETGFFHGNQFVVEATPDAVASVRQLAPKAFEISNDSVHGPEATVKTLMQAGQMFVYLGMIQQGVPVEEIKKLGRPHQPWALTYYHDDYVIGQPVHAIDQMVQDQQKPKAWKQARTKPAPADFETYQLGTALIGVGYGLKRLLTRTPSSIPNPDQSIKTRLDQQRAYAGRRLIEVLKDREPADIEYIAAVHTGTGDIYRDYGDAGNVDGRVNLAYARPLQVERDLTQVRVKRSVRSNEGVLRMLVHTDHYTVSSDEVFANVGRPIEVPTASQAIENLVATAQKLSQITTAVSRGKARTVTERPDAVFFRRAVTVDSAIRI